MVGLEDGSIILEREGQWERRCGGWWEERESEKKRGEGKDFIAKTRESAHLVGMRTII